jgi:hypothetical protein
MWWQSRYETGHFGHQHYLNESYLHSISRGLRWPWGYPPATNSPADWYSSSSKRSPMSRTRRSGRTPAPSGSWPRSTAICPPTRSWANTVHVESPDRIALPGRPAHCYRCAGIFFSLQAVHLRLADSLFPRRSPNPARPAILLLGVYPELFATRTRPSEASVSHWINWRRRRFTRG